MRILINDSKGIEAAPIVHRNQLLSQFLNLFNGFNLLHYDLEHSIFKVKLSDPLPMPVIVILHG
jgi:hypothetical protein